METKEYDIMYLAEASHWWYTGMTQIARSVIETCYHQGKHLRILDAGCGTGAGMVWLSRYGRVSGLDISLHALHLSQTRGHRELAAASLMEIPFANETFDLVTSFDVLYFAGVNDEAALQEFFRILAPGGRVLVRVPAFNWLRGIHDIKVSTGHRYTVKELSTKMNLSGLQPEFLSYANMILFPLAALKRLSERWLPQQTDSDITIDLKYLNKLFQACLMLESRFITHWSFPFGLSVIGVGKKPFG